MSNQDEIAHPRKRSAPGKLAIWIWQRTPAGRAETQRTLLRTIAEEQARIAERDQKVRQLLAAINTPQDFRETLAELSARHAALQHGATLAELRALRSAYDSWMADVEDLIGTRETKEARSASARQQLAQLQADLAQLQVSPEYLARLAHLEARLADLDESEAQLLRLWHSANDRQVWIHQLGTAYRSLEAETLALRKAACPDETK